MLANFSGAEFKKRTVPNSEEKKKKVLVSCSPILNKTWSFFKTSQSCDEGNEMYKKRDARVKLLFCRSTGLFTWTLAKWCNPTERVKK